VPCTRYCAGISLPVPQRVLSWWTFSLTEFHGTVLILNACHVVSWGECSAPRDHTALRVRNDRRDVRPDWSEAADCGEQRSPMQSRQGRGSDATTGK
jgi:hypothetical protein